jgi:thioredoxin 1
MGNDLLHLTDEDFAKTLSSTDTPVLVDFWAPWCGPCQILGPVMEGIAKELGDTALITKMNVDENPQTAGAFGIMSIPTVIVFFKGEPKKALIGVQPKEAYIQAIEAAKGE